VRGATMIDKLCQCGHPRSGHGAAVFGCACIHVLDDTFNKCICEKFTEEVEPAAPWVRAIMNIDTTATRATHDQPPPKPEDVSKPAVWPLVIVDMCERDRVGRARYGTPLQPHNGRDALKDAYQEALDLAAYLRQAIYERDGK
jgi:hypothetical protein